LIDFSERRIHSAKNSGGRISQCAEKFFGSAGALPSKTIRHSLLAIRCRFPIWEFEVWWVRSSSIAKGDRCGRTTECVGGNACRTWWNNWSG